MKFLEKYRILYLGLAVFMLAFDQISKWWITEYKIKPALGITESFGLWDWYAMASERLPYVAIDIFPFFNIVMVWNRGVSFGMLIQDSDLGSWMLVGLTALITIWFAIWLFIAPSKLQKTAIALVIGGAIGNAIDRIRFGGVIDFLDVHIGAWHYPAFNVADSCIVVGVFMLIIYALFFEKNFHSKG